LKTKRSSISGVISSGDLGGKEKKQVESKDTFMGSFLLTRGVRGSEREVIVRRMDASVPRCQYLHQGAEKSERNIGGDEIRPNSQRAEEIECAKIEGGLKKASSLARAGQKSTEKLERKRV